MFEKTKIIWHLTNLESIAGTPSSHREAIATLAARTGLIDRAIGFTKDARDPELGAAYLVISLCEIATESKAPPEIMYSLSELLSQTTVAIQSQMGRNPVVAMSLLSSALGAHVELLAATNGGKE